ncbi:hypothetical protein BDZ94DRAFT_1310454 [Collybia nuda]|uniref:Uncharacterized protein n=1 Tax=Collybia nuda TaxID=64659 RepID=A0A9P5Y1H6_9AGAR|nr:hypothetical protein BDZ94DRAFT_1310454 [Collybia nuda]
MATTTTVTITPLPTTETSVMTSNVIISTTIFTTSEPTTLISSTPVGGSPGPITVTVFTPDSASGTNTIGDHGSPKSPLSGGVSGGIIGGIVTVCILAIVFGAYIIMRRRGWKLHRRQGDKPDTNTPTPEIEIRGDGYNHLAPGAYETTTGTHVVQPHRFPGQPEIHSPGQSPPTVHPASTLPSYPGTARGVSPPDYVVHSHQIRTKRVVT